VNYTRVLRNICPPSCEQICQYEITVLLHFPPASTLKRRWILFAHCVCVFRTILTVNSISIQNKQFVIVKKSALRKELYFCMFFTWSSWSPCHISDCSRLFIEEAKIRCQWHRDGFPPSTLVCCWKYQRILASSSDLILTKGQTWEAWKGASKIFSWIRIVPDFLVILIHHFLHHREYRKRGGMEKTGMILVRQIEVTENSLFFCSLL
jgi:hypothetical protein